MASETKKTHIKKELRRFCILLLIFAAFLFITSTIKANTRSVLSVVNYATTDIIHADGTTEHIDSNYFGTVGRSDQVIVHAKLPKELEIPSAALCFDIYHCVVEVRYGDTVLNSGGAEIEAKGNMIGYAEYSTLIPQEAWGDELTLYLTPTEPNAFSRVQYLRIYPAPESYQFFVDADPIRFFTALPMFAVTLLFLLLVILMPQQRRLMEKGICFATCMLFLATYLLIKSELPYMAIARSNVWSNIEFTASMIVSYPLLLYVVLSMKKPYVRRTHAVIFGLECLFFVIVTVLHYTNVVHYCVTLNYAHIFTALNAAIVLGYAITANGSNSMQAYSSRLLYNGFVLAALCGLLEVLRNTILNVFGIGISSVIHFGLMSMLVCMILSYLLEVAEHQKQVIEEQMKSQKLEQLVARIPAGICVIDLADDGRILQANEAFFHIRGYTKQEILEASETSLYDCVQEKDRHLGRELAAQIKQGGAPPSNLEVSVYNKDNERVDLLVKSSVDRDDMTAIVNVVDITERKKAEEELRLSEMRYRLALTQSGKAFFFLDVATRIMHLSDDLAKVFRIPKDVGNMPQGFLQYGYIEEKSRDAFCAFFDKIYRGDASGSIIVGGHRPETPDKVLWYRMAFTSVMDAQGVPLSAAITYEDMQEQHASEIAGAWKQQNLISLPEAAWSVAEYNLTQGRLIRNEGGLYPPISPDVGSYEDINGFVTSNFIYSEDVPAYRTFLDRGRILAMFDAGKTEDSIDYRSVQSGATPRWTRTSFQLIRDPYSGDVLMQMIFRDINREKTGQLEMQHDMEQLKKDLENSRIRIMINQMQPHFLYNALSAIQTIVKTDPDYAYQLIYDFTVHLRSSIKALSSDAPIPFTDELKNIKAYLNIEQMRFGDCLKIKYDIECDNFKVIPLSIQPLAENAARHGVYPKGEEGGTVTIHTFETPTAYVVEVIDDGVGFDPEEILARQGDSIGLKNMIFRMKSLMNADVTIDSRIGEGTKVTVTIPINAPAETPARNAVPPDEPHTKD